MKKKEFAVVILCLSLIIFYFLIFPTFNITQFLESLKRTDLFIYSLALFVVLLSNIISAHRWSLLMQHAGAKKSMVFLNALGIFSLGQATGLIVPTRVGSYSKAPLVMKMDNLSHKTALTAVNAETIVDLIYICLAGIVSLMIMSVQLSMYFFLSMVLIFLIMACLIICFIIFYKIHSLQDIYKNLLTISNSDKHIVVKLPALLLGKLFDLVVSAREIFSEKIIVMKLVFFTLITQLIGVIGFFLVIESAHVTLPFVYVFAILTLSFLIGIISMIPGGMGASDLSMIVLLEHAGIAFPVATSIALLWRFAMYLPIIGVSGMYLIKIQFYPER